MLIAFLFLLKQPTRYFRSFLFGFVYSFLQLMLIIFIIQLKLIYSIVLIIFIGFVILLIMLIGFVIIPLKPIDFVIIPTMLTSLITIITINLQFAN